ncbi:MAG: TetR/AcrR family transcriptional regulator [Planctomycetota bacterium]
MRKSDVTTEARPRGRPRDPSIDRAILETTLDHLARYGYAGMSITGIAEDAGVTKPALYRRFDGKADLATAALMHLQAGEPPAQSDDLETDLVALLRGFQRSLMRPNGFATLGTLLSEEERTPELIALFRRRISRRRRAMFRAAFEGAIERGELERDYDVEAAVNMLIGSLYARYIAEGRIPRDWPRRVVAALFAG